MSYSVLIKLAQMEAKLEHLLAHLHAQGEILVRITELLEDKQMTPEEFAQVVNRLKSSATRLQTLQKEQNSGNPASTH
jgi:ribonuclease PH